MSTIALERPALAPVFIAPPVPLTPAEEDTLLLMAVGVEKPGRVKRASTNTRPGESRAWSRGGRVD